MNESGIYDISKLLRNGVISGKAESSVILFEGDPM
jgi:hypothetical protein